MDSWTAVKWTDARQIAGAMEMDDSDRPSEGVDPRSYYLALREKGDLDRAIFYLGQALPRFEAVAWAARLLQNRSRKTRLPPRDRQALDRSLRWLEEPIDEYRRAAYDAAQAAGTKSPERLLALAVYTSGGSMAPPDLPPVNPPQEICGKVAAGAVLMAAFLTDNPDAAKAVALDLGDKVAAEGVKALASQ